MSKVQLSGNANGTGIFTIASPNSNTDRTLTLPNETGTLLTSGGAISGTTGTFTGLLNISAAGAGQIQFPATQNASSNANTLDDYEEGFWTPTFTSSGTNPTITYAEQYGSYVKVGRWVYFQFYVRVNTISAVGSGNLYVSGLPFVSANAVASPAVGYGGATVTWKGATNWSTRGPDYGHIESASTNARMYQNTSTSQTWLDVSNITNGCDVIMSGWYFASN